MHLYKEDQRPTPLTPENGLCPEDCAVPSPEFHCAHLPHRKRIHINHHRIHPIRGIGDEQDPIRGVEVVTITVTILIGERLHIHLIIQTVRTVNVEMDVVGAVIAISVTKTMIRLVRESVVARIHLVTPTRSQNTRSIL